MRMCAYIIDPMLARARRQVRAAHEDAYAPRTAALLRALRGTLRPPPPAAGAQRNRRDAASQQLQAQQTRACVFQKKLSKRKDPVATGMAAGLRGAGAGDHVTGA